MTGRAVGLLNQVKTIKIASWLRHLRAKVSKEIAPLVDERLSLRS
jgi:hypothetical protein